MIRLIVDAGNCIRLSTNLLRDECAELLKLHALHVREHFEDLAEIRDFTWGAG